MKRSTQEILLNKVNANARLLLEETRKLATYLGEEGSEVTAKLIEELVPNFGEGDFFETTEAFFSRNLKWTLDALRRHFFAGHDAAGDCLAAESQSVADSAKSPHRRWGDPDWGSRDFETGIRTGGRKIQRPFRWALG